MAKAGITWLRITVPGKADGDSGWVEFGTQSNPPSAAAPSGSTSDYTVNGQSNADGSSSFSRTDKNPTTGDKETTFGGKDADGNFSYSSSIEHADGSVTLVTRSVDANGNGTEHVTDVDAKGNTTRDQTLDVKGGVTVVPGPGAPGGPSAGNDGPGDAGGSPGNGPVASGGPADTASPGAGGPGAGDSPGTSAADPNNPGQPDSPDAPDNGGGGGGGAGGGASGMGSDDGTDDRAPGIPWGKIGHRGGDSLDGVFSGARDGGSGGDGGEEGTAADRNEGWLRQLIGEIDGPGSGAGSGGGSGGGADETGWGSGEGPVGRPLVSGSYSPPPPSADETGWGDTNNPRALTALVATFAQATAALARSATMVKP